MPTTTAERSNMTSWENRASLVNAHPFSLSGTIQTQPSRSTSVCKTWTTPLLLLLQVLSGVIASCPRLTFELPNLFHNINNSVTGTFCCHLQIAKNATIVSSGLPGKTRATSSTNYHLRLNPTTTPPTKATYYPSDQSHLLPFRPKPPITPPTKATYYPSDQTHLLPLHSPITLSSLNRQSKAFIS